MQVQYCSDLHLELEENDDFLRNNPIIPIGTILVLAGDIVPLALMHKQKDFFNKISADFEMVFWIPGNHEYYFGDASERTGSFSEEIRKNVIFLNNSVIELHGIKFIFSTLWSKIQPDNELAIIQKLNDFRLIKYCGKKLTARQFNVFHGEAITFLGKEIAKDYTGNRIVVTHYVPTYFSYPEKYKMSNLNNAFVTELFDLIETSGVQHWIFGHSHHNVSDFIVGDTQIHTNQLGYLYKNQISSINFPIKIVQL